MDHEPDFLLDERPRLSIGRAFVRGTWRVVRYVLYMVLMMLRIPLQILGQFLFLPLVGLGVFWGFVAGWHSPACFWMIGSVIGLYVLGFLFDTLLLWVSPEQLYLET